VQILIRELSRLECPLLERHFLALGAQDRRLRFGVPLNHFAIRSYVARIDFERDAVFVVSGDDLHHVGVAHLGRARDHAELGISVLEGQRNRGIGGALLARAHLRARNWGVRALLMHCLTENAAMMRLARNQGMAIVAAAGETDAWLELPPADAATHFGEVFEQRAALFDYTLKQGRALLSRGK
jgi:GNAT superfamily N-acetyltransferase